MAVQAVAWVLYFGTVTGGMVGTSLVLTRALQRRFATGTKKTTWFGHEVEVYDTGRTATIAIIVFNAVVLFFTFAVLMILVSYVMQAFGLL